MKILLISILVSFVSISHAQSSKQFRCITNNIDQPGNIIDLQFKTQRRITKITFSNYNPENFKEDLNDPSNWKNSRGEFRCEFRPSEIECKGLKENEMFKLTVNVANRARIHYHMMGKGGLVVLDSSKRPEDCKILGEENLAPKGQAN